MLQPARVTHGRRNATVRAAARTVGKVIGSMLVARKWCRRAHCRSTDRGESRATSSAPALAESDSSLGDILARTLLCGSPDQLDRVPGPGVNDSTKRFPMRTDRVFSSTRLSGPRPVSRDRRRRTRLRDLCDEVLASFRLASDRDPISEQDREAALQLLPHVAPRMSPTARA